ncbi:Dam family site-specific DNA-(adenine-N6)-methyltransferase [Mesorhizobium sp. M7A.F.Ca.MR.148.00.0.0]|uniref:DNA adenine methylase n=1 Tax=Mesorhizobium sp. M7A.F.Ca.MR.148.00.0.0 TaxID=2496775 RepID=UPI000FCBC9F0|nr:Dam family site-specific DNA-(adenine-N6)-methyltransferase [Mesorhizobium sp. M7A.F.Ca.MR.148.00.0.0]RUV35982.1 Dam family site-specific DNA-(adenine-N6)-methyltransferase [Mesorhizobium sp. M7A.F.Ca.MR.148.00.0.0]
MDSQVQIDSISPRAFLRWAGGKSWLVRRFEDIFGPISFTRYHEPFLGGGSFFFAAATNVVSYLSDKNEALIETYQSIKDDCDSVIEQMRSYENTSDEYYRIRALKSEDRFERAAQFVYLNQTSFNGIYRVNLKGVYNVPYGSRTKKFLDENVIRSASKALSVAVLQSKDFAETIGDVAAGDLVFIDPPYTVSHNNNGFIKYNKSLFSIDDQGSFRAIWISNPGCVFASGNFASPASISIPICDRWATPPIWL